MIGGVIQVTMLNYAMKKYNQLEVIPVYMSFLTLGNMFSGMYVLDECRFYTGIE